MGRGWLEERLGMEIIMVEVKLVCGGKNNHEWKS